MFGITESQLERLKLQYPEGTIVELISMENDPRPIAPGMLGKVLYIDDLGTIHVAWQNGRLLGLVPGEDSFRVIR